MSRNCLVFRIFNLEQISNNLFAKNIFFSETVESFKIPLLFVNQDKKGSLSKELAAFTEEFSSK